MTEFYLLKTQYYIDKLLWILFLHKKNGYVKQSVNSYESKTLGKLKEK